MSILFTLIFLLSPVFLIVGLIRPKTFEKILKSRSRKHIGIVFCAIILASIIGMIATTDSSKIQQNKSEAENESGVSTVQTDTSAQGSTINPSELANQNSTESEQIIIADDIKVETNDSIVVSTTNKESSPTQTIDESSQTKKDTYQVASVVDGDTIKVSINGATKTIRLIGIDTPETVDPRKVVQCFGKDASEKAKAVLSNKEVVLEADSTQGDADKYGRLLRYVFLEDGTLFNKMMIEQGFAYEYTYDSPYKYQSTFKAAQKIAQASQVGLWSPTTCNGDTTKEAVTVQSATETTQPIQANGHIFYLSTYHTATNYYCDTDSTWKGLSSKYLKSYSSESALLKDYPNRKLHKACK